MAELSDCVLGFSKSLSTLSTGTAMCDIFGDN